ncbi:glycosyl transferase [Pseudoalteromonas sp. S2893]|uniref:glycosyl transferase n=1 Tax=Pseudoalteromonas sp. S2893 TaxID=579530 RepID=UPI00110C16B3|nr:glycosyl transferase [Pseudoalteromonas sp. S2893]TMP13893.1 glycosyl transferase [Pseudoalteromonas sp. S2893]
MFKKVVLFLKKLFNLITSFENKLALGIKINYFQGLSLSAEGTLIEKNSGGRKELIVSFTTYSKRIHDVHLVVESIAQQTLKPDRFILWLDEDEFTLDSIPLILKKQMARGLEVRFCPNYKSYKKLIPTVELFPDANIVTIDDDVLYPHDMLELLHREHLAHPESIIAHCTRKMTYDKSGKVGNYRSWKHEEKVTEPNFDSVAIGVGGVLYPTNSLSSECLNIENFSTLAPNADDIWFKAMALLNNTKHKKVSDDRDFKSRFLVIESSQDIALANSNMLQENRNDLQINAVFERYGLPINPSISSKV